MTGKAHMATELQYPLPEEGQYVLYDTKERRGWWAGGGNYTIWPGKAKIYSGSEVNLMLERSEMWRYAEIGRAQDLALSCIDFVGTLTLQGGPQS